MPLNPELSNNIEKVKNYVDDPTNTYAVWRASSLTTDLETPFTQFIGASTLSYPVMPFNNDELEDYSRKSGFQRTDAVLERRELTVTQDKGYQMGIDYLDLEDSHTTAVAYYNNAIRQKDVPSIDRYRLAKLVAGAGETATGATTKSNFFTQYDAAVAKAIDNEIPLGGSILYVSTGTYTAMKNAEEVKRVITMQDKNIDRNVEYLDSTTKIVVVPATRMPANTEWILVQPTAVICGVKHSVSRFVTEPEDFDGVLINRRIVHDLFVQQDRAKGVFVQKTSE